MLELAQMLFTELNTRGVRYCHWKSNAALDQALAGAGDLDLLVDPTDWTTFEAVLADLGFLRARLESWQTRPDAHQYYGHDEQSGQLVHLDVYDRLVTGGTLLKNHHLPLEEMIFESRRFEGQVPVPSRGAELVLLVLRKTIESASLPEHLLLLREFSHVLGELRWLADDEAREQAHVLLRQWLPSLDPALFERCLEALGSSYAVPQRLLLGWQLTRVLRAHELQPGARAALERCARLARWMLVRMGLGARGVDLTSTGVIVALVGPEASGKSTRVAETSDWLGQVFAVQVVQPVKPPPSLLTSIPNFFLPLLRTMLPDHRTTIAEPERITDASGRCSLAFWLHRLRCVSLAYDRWLLLKKAGRLRARGGIVVCDRYPTTRLGAIDGPQLARLSVDGAVASGLVRLERWLYEQAPRPDLLMVCSVPVAEAVRRNAHRRKPGGPEPEEFVRRRHAQFLEECSADGHGHTIDTTQPLKQTRSAIRRLVWHALADGRHRC
jgi:thymidylate kinase